MRGAETRKVGKTTFFSGFLSKPVTVMLTNMTAETVIKQIENLPAAEKEKVLSWIQNDGSRGQAKHVPKRIPTPDLHPGAMEMAPDFDDPLPADFLLRQE